MADLRGATIGIGPDGSGTAYLMKQLFADADLQGLDVRLSHHELSEQARLVAEGKLDLAAFVMQENAEFLGDVIRRHGLDIVAPSDLHGLVARHPWLSLGQIPAGRYDLVHPVPATDKPVVRLQTLLIASPCAQRADRIALLMLAAAELPNFVSQLRDDPGRAGAHRLLYRRQPHQPGKVRDRRQRRAAAERHRDLPFRHQHLSEEEDASNEARAVEDGTRSAAPAGKGNGQQGEGRSAGHRVFSISDASSR